MIFGGQQQWTFDGDLNDRQVHVAFGGQSLGFWQANNFLIYYPRVLDDRALRGGPVAVRPGRFFGRVQGALDTRRAIVLNAQTQLSRNEEGGFGSSLLLDARLKPSSNVSVTLGPSYSLATSIQQYVTAVNDANATGFYGRRYVLSVLTQKTLSLDTRLNVTFSPTATLELYAQPFIAIPVDIRRRIPLIQMERARLLRSPLTIRISTSVRCGGMQCFGGSTIPVQRCISCGLRRAPIRRALVTATSHVIARRCLPRGRTTSSW